MFSTLPDNAKDTLDWGWSQFEPYYEQLFDCPLNSENLSQWLKDWTKLGELVRETSNRLYIATTVNTKDREAERMYESFLDNIFPESETAEQKLKTRLLQSRLKLPGFELQLRNMQAEADLFQEENLPLLTQELKLSTEYDKIAAAQTVTWEGKEVTLPQLEPVYQDPDRKIRERAWKLSANRSLEDRQAINELWGRFLDTRLQIHQNSGLPDYRAYCWKQLQRFDYTPKDCDTFHNAIEQVVVPAAERIYDKRRANLNLDTLRPWDLNVDPYGKAPLRPFTTINELENKTQEIFSRVDPQLGVYFKIMREEGLLDLDNRKGKAPGGYCEDLPAVKRPFIFTNAVGVHEDVLTLIHEGGHAFHVFETAQLPYLQQRDIGSEIAEVASMSMELLAAPYLTFNNGGFYSAEEAARARIEHIESAVCFWPYMAVVDAFQHWIYLNPVSAADPVECDAEWGRLWHRFMRGVDWSGLEEPLVTGWHRKLHIHQAPFYYIEYGLAQLGAFQIWKNAIDDQSQAVINYRKALSLGATASLPELFNAAGVKFAFDADTLQSAIDLAESTISELEEHIRS